MDFSIDQSLPFIRIYFFLIKMLIFSFQSSVNADCASTQISLLHHMLQSERSISPFHFLPTIFSRIFLLFVCLTIFNKKENFKRCPGKKQQFLGKTFEFIEKHYEVLKQVLNLNKEKSSFPFPSLSLSLSPP